MVGAGDVDLHRLDAGGFQIGHRDHGEHAGGCSCGLDIERLHDAMGDAAAEHHAVGLAGQVEVVGVAPLAPKQHGVLHARNRLSDREAANVHCTIHEMTLADLFRLNIGGRSRGATGSLAPCVPGECDDAAGHEQQQAGDAGPAIEAPQRRRQNAARGATYVVGGDV